ncbi:MAG TPA: DUF4340 domain-containing protein [Gemmataceae bacterium]|nr:DUF4340 domain-containing protein [Gemmataceae bacterium]
MNFKTTIFLAVLAVIGGVLWLVVPWHRRAASGSESLAVLENELKPENLEKLEITADGRTVVLERGSGSEWTLPGHWPTRQTEADRLVRTLTSLQSRFAPIPLGNPADVSPYGLDKPQLTVQVKTKDKSHQLQLAEEPGESNRFSRPTFLRVDENNEVIRLAPGLVTSLIRPFGFYQQHRLFPAEPIKEGEDKTERLIAKTIAVEEKKNPPTQFTLSKTGDDWQLQNPVRDVPDPDKLKAILTAVPDIWAEKFVENPDKDLSQYGLKEPEQTIQVTKNNGEVMILLIGKESHEERRTVTKPAPPFGPPQPPKPETIVEKYRYAKLKDNDQVFEIRDAKLKDIFVPLNTLRDAHLARFSSFDAQRLEITHDGQDILLEKDKTGWKLKKPVEADADGSKVTELLDKLSNLEARDQDVIDKGDAKTFGLDKPAGTIQVKIEESKGEGEKKTTKTKEYKFLLGKRDAAKSKMYVQAEGGERINAVEDSLWKLVDRPVLAYRNKRVLDFMTGDLAKVDIQRGGEKFSLEQVKDSWQLTSPVKVEADQAAANKLAGDLGRMEVADFVANDAKKDDLERLYGLAKPEVSATVSFTTKDKKPQTLEVGKQRGDKLEFFAKLASSPAIFVVKKELRDALDQSSLAYRPKQLWNIKAEDIAELHLQKEGQNEQLKREGAEWRVVEPFRATALPNQVDKIVKALAAPNCVRFETHIAKELKTYGLDKPYLRVAVVSAEFGGRSKSGGDKNDTEKKDESKTKEKLKEHVLLIGQPTAAGASTRFAKLGDAEAVFVVDQAVAGPLDQSALDLLDRGILRLDPKSIVRIQSNIGGATLILERDKEIWRVQSGQVPPFAADKEVMEGLFKVLSNLQAQKFAAYGSQVNAAEYGLDKPTATITVNTVSVEPNPNADKKPTAKGEHKLILGKAVGKETAGHYARLDNGPGIAILSAAEVAELSPSYLDFVNRNLLEFDAAAVTAIHRRMGNEELEIVKRDDGWRLIKPGDLRGDDATVDRLLEQVSHLRAQRVAAYQVKDLKPFGLDAPAATITLRLPGSGSKPVEHVLKIGKPVDAKSPRASPLDRFVLADGSNTVAILDGALGSKLLAGPLQFRDRILARFADADKAVLERGPRKAVFAKVDGTWKLTGPLAADAEQTDLEDLVNALARLRADELAAEKPTDLKPYGLDKPEVRWRFLSGDKEVLALLIGAPEKTKQGEGPRHYAKLANSDLIVLLDPGLSKKVLAEYRNRNAWSGLDAAQVERISFGYSQNPFVLEKVDNSWHVAGKPAVPIQAERVSETLDSLSRLKAERYIVDQGTDWKLYGLDPPHLTLEVQSASGKKTLQIGRHEGNSKNYYARVLEPNRSDVFLIGEADAAKILRDIPSFTK